MSQEIQQNKPFTIIRNGDDHEPGKGTIVTKTSIINGRKFELKLKYDDQHVDLKKIKEDLKATEDKVAALASSYELGTDSKLNFKSDGSVFIKNESGDEKKALGSFQNNTFKASKKSGLSDEDSDKITQSFIHFNSQQRNQIGKDDEPSHLSKLNSHIKNFLDKPKLTSDPLPKKIQGAEESDHASVSVSEGDRPTVHLEKMSASALKSSDTDNSFYLLSSRLNALLANEPKDDDVDGISLHYEKLTGLAYESDYLLQDSDLLVTVKHSSLSDLDYQINTAAREYFNKHEAVLGSTI